jgi:hypothetical protein
MTEYWLLSDSNSASSSAEILIQKIGGHVRRVYYQGTRDRSLIHPHPNLYRRSGNEPYIEIARGLGAVIKLMEIIETRRYLLSWLILENKTSLRLVELISAKF